MGQREGSGRGQFEKWELDAQKIRDVASRLDADTDPEQRQTLELQWQSIYDAIVSEQSKIEIPKAGKGKEKKKKKKKAKRAGLEEGAPLPEDQVEDESPTLVMKCREGLKYLIPLRRNPPLEITGEQSLWDTLKDKESSNLFILPKSEVPFETAPSQQLPLSSVVIVGRKIYEVITIILATFSNDQKDPRWDPFCNAMQEVGLASQKNGKINGSR